MTLVQTKTFIEDLLVIEPKVHFDKRGYFFESFNHKEFNELIGADVNFVQDNQSSSDYGTIRGLHYQSEKAAQGKLVQVIEGEIFDVAVDIRKNSETFGKWVGVILNEQNNNLFWIPEGFAHGFYVLSKSAKVFYHLTNYYNPEEEHCIKWNDEDLNINWPSKENPIVSEKDQRGKKFKESVYFNN